MPSLTLRSRPECAVSSLSDGSRTNLTQMYQKLALIYHPDRNIASDKTNDYAEQFVKVDKAWKILGDEESRKVYDAIWKQREMVQEWPIQDDVHVEEVEEEEDGLWYWAECRCAGKYILQKLEVDIKVDFALCDSCSLCIRVLHN